MSTATTLAPSAMKRSAIALPIPEPVPVINATLPCNLPVMTMLPTLVCKTIPRSRGPRAEERQHVDDPCDLLSRLAYGCTTPLLFGVYASPIGIPQDSRITASQGRVQTLGARSRARIQARQVGQQALYCGHGIGPIGADDS